MLYFTCKEAKVYTVNVYASARWGSPASFIQHYPGNRYVCDVLTEKEFRYTLYLYMITESREATTRAPKRTD